MYWRLHTISGWTWPLVCRLILILYFNIYIIKGWDSEVHCSPQKISLLYFCAPVNALVCSVWIIFFFNLEKQIRLHPSCPWNVLNLYNQCNKNSQMNWLTPINEPRAAEEAFLQHSSCAENKLWLIWPNPADVVQHDSAELGINRRL